MTERAGLVARGPRPGRPWLARYPWLLLTSPAIALTTLLASSLGILVVFSFFTEQRGRTIETFSLRSWQMTLSDPFFWDVLLRTTQLAATITVLSLVVGYPAAYALAKVRDKRLLAVAYVAIFSPLLVSIVVRAYGWLLLLADEGVVNFALRSVGIVEEPIRLIFNLTGVQIALVHGYMPFMVFPLVGVMSQVQTTYKEAAQDLGATRLGTFRRVTLPLTLPGIVAGCQIVFIFALGTFVTPVLIGGGRVLVTGRQAWENVTNFNWPRAAIEVFALLAITMLVVFLMLALTHRTYLGALRTRS